MARLIQAYRKSFSFISKTLVPQIQLHQYSLKPNKSISNFVAQCSSNNFSTSTVPKPPFESNILRILGNEIEYHSEYAPSFEEPTFIDHLMEGVESCGIGNGNSLGILASTCHAQHRNKSCLGFEVSSIALRTYRISSDQICEVEDRSREQWVTLKGKSDMDENIKLEATMFDGYDNTGSDIKLHISLLVDISKGDGSNLLEFACSAWPDRLEIQKVYIFRCDGTLANPYTGPKFSDLDKDLQNALYEFLKARGVNNDLSVFLHEYMIKKDKIELIRWLEKLKFVMAK